MLLGFISGDVRNYIEGIYHSRPYPGNTYLFHPSVRFTDFTGIVQASANLNPYFSEVPSGQFPFLNLTGYLFSFFPDGGLTLYFGLVVLPFFLLCLISFRKFSPQYFMNSVILTLLGYPLLFTIDRGNFEGLLFTLLLWFAYALVRGWFLGAAFALGLAIALKGFPLVFLPLLLFRHRYRESIVAVAAAGALTFLSLAVFEGGLLKNLEFLMSGSNFAHPAIQSFLIPANTAQRGVSLYSLFKVGAVYFDFAWSIDYSQALFWYRLFATAAYFPLLWLAYLHRNELWKSFGIMTVAALLLPHLSGHYKLIHLLIVIFLFVIRDGAGRFDAWYAAIFGLLMIPKPYFFLEKMFSDAPGHDLSIALVMDPLLLCVLLFLFSIEKPINIVES